MPNLDDLIPLLLIQYPCLLFSLCFHEAAHAWTADRCGDPSARLLGRVTMNPVKHADPVGTVAMPIIMMLFQVPFLFGWAKPVPFNPVNLKNIRRDPVLIAMAGPASNVLLAIVTVVLIRGLLFFYYDLEILPAAFAGEALTFLGYFAMINLVLALFNLIPVPPLDGHYFLAYFLPPDKAAMFQQIGPMGIFIAIIVANSFLPIVLWPIYNILMTAAGL